MTGDPTATGGYLLTGLAVPEGLADLHDLLARVAEDHPGVSATDLMLFETAVIEIANNVVEHGRPEGRVHWSFRMEVHPDRIQARLTDDGQAFGGVPDGREMPDELSEAGRGLALAIAALDHLEYERRDAANHWNMERQRS